MQEAKFLAVYLRERAPICPRLFQQCKCAVDIRADEIIRPADRPVDVALRREMHDGIGLMLFKQRPDGIAIANVAVNERIARIGDNARQIARIPRVGQLVQIDDGSGFALHLLQNKVRADESCASGDQNCVVHKNTDRGVFRCRRETSI